MRAMPAISLIAFLAGSGIAAAQPAGAPPPAPPMGLTSTSFTDGGVIPDKYTQAVPAPVSPALSWTNVPAGTQSLTLIMHDPDTAPRKGVTDILHWMVINIPATMTALPEGVPADAQLPGGAIQPNNFAGRVGFMGPGARGEVFHHYTLELYALDTKLPLTAAAARADVMAAMDGHVLGKAVLVGRFHR